MKRKIEEKPKRGNRASILAFEVTLSFYRKDQMEETVRLLCKDPVLCQSFSVEHVLGDTDGTNSYIIAVRSHWANNLKRLGKLLEKYVDYID